MANITMVFLFTILFYLISSEAFIHRFRYERGAIPLGSYAAKYPSILQRNQNVTTPGRNSTGNSTIPGGNSTIGGNSTTPRVSTWISKFPTPAQNSTPKAQPSPVANSTTPGVSNKFSTPAQSSTPKAHPSPTANSNGSSRGTPHPTSTFASGKSPGHAGTSAKSSTPASKPTSTGTSAKGSTPTSKPISAATSAKSSTPGKASQATSHPDSPSSAQSPPPNASSPGSLPASIPSSHVSTSGSPATTSQPTSTPNPHPSHGDTSATDLPVSTDPSSTGSVGPSQTSNATIFPILFGGLYKNRNTVLDDDKHKTDYVNQIHDSRTKIKNYLDYLPNKPDTNSVQCSSNKRKRSLISDIAGFAGNVVKLVTCADQLLDNLDGVVKGVHPSINDIDTLTGAINVIGDDINTDNKDNTNDNQPSSAKKSAESTAKPTSTDPASSTSPPSSAHTTTTPSTTHTTVHSTTTPSTTHTTTTPSSAPTTTTPSSAPTTTTPSTAPTTTTPSTARSTTPSIARSTTPSTARSTTTPSTAPTTTTPSTARSTTPSTARSTTTPSTAHTTTTPSTTQPQSSCTQTAVSRCTEILTVSTSYFPSSSGSTVFTITATSCVTTSACSGTIMTTTVSETSSPTGSSRPLLIIRDSNQTDESEIKNFEQELTEQLGEGNFNTTRGSPQLGVVFWSAWLNSSQVEEFSNSSVVSGIVEDQALSTTGWAPYDITGGPYPSPRSTNTSDISKRANSSRLISQYDALASLRVVSQPHNVTIIDLTDDYKYNSAAGSGITVYLIDTGANPQNSEYYSMPGTKRWMFPQNAGEPGAVIRTQSDEQNHGSCVLSKIAGPKYGVAKDVDVVIVKVPTAAMQDTVMASGMLELLAEVSEDIAKNKLQGKAVINFSGGIYLPVTGFDPVRLSYIATLRGILRLDVPIVCTAGNFGEDVAIEHWPAAYADRYDGIIVVGASNNDGIKQDFSQPGPVVSIYAPGFNVTCADSIQDNIIRYSGTSLAAPAVAGLAAYFMSIPEFESEIQQQGRVAGNVKRLITRLAYPRHGGVPVLWNRENSDSCVNFQRRDGSSAKVCSVRTSTKPTSTKPTSTKPASTKPIPKATSTDGVKTSHHAQPPPPITHCNAVFVPPKTIARSTFTAASYCACNGGWLLDLGTTVGANHYTTYTCNVGTKSTMAVGNVAHTTTTSADSTTTCTAHVTQKVSEKESDAPPISLTVNITNENVGQIGYNSGNLNWANKFNVGGLPWVLVLTPTTGDPNNNGQGGQNLPEWRNGPLVFAYSRLIWDSKSENCDVVTHDDLSTRVMNCIFECP